LKLIRSPLRSFAVRLIPVPEKAMTVLLPIPRWKL